VSLNTLRNLHPHSNQKQDSSFYPHQGINQKIESQKGVE